MSRRVLELAHVEIRCRDRRAALRRASGLPGLSIASDPIDRPVPARRLDRHPRPRARRQAGAGAWPARGDRQSARGRRLDRGRSRGGRRAHRGTRAHTPPTHKTLPYDPVKSFAPVSLMAIVPSVLVVNPSLPVTSAAELIAYAKAHPGKLAYGSAGNGSTSHLTTEYFKLVTGTDILHVPYKGVGPMLTDLVSGQLSMGLNGAPSVMAHVNAGRLRALAVTSLKRLEALPQVPTLDEAGVRGFDASGWYGVVAPAGTPQAIVARLNAAVGRAIQTPELRAGLDSEGALAAPGCVCDRK